MTSKPVAELLADLGVTKTHSRPSVGNDNPFSEAQFKTLKYRPEFPDRFGSIQDSRAFCVGSSTGTTTAITTRGSRFSRRRLCITASATVIERRTAVLAAAYAAHPERFVRRAPRPAEPPTAVWINPPKSADGHGDLQ